MDTADVLQISNSSLCSRREDLLSRSSQYKDNEEALEWAALEKLPTYDRVQKGILMTDDGKQKVVDIKHLSAQERKALVDRLVAEDNETFLLKLKERIDRVGINLPTVEVRYEHLNVKAEAYVGNRRLPTILNALINVLETIGNKLHMLPSRKKPLPILHDVNGIIKPHSMTLLLGPPGSGKTTLLLALAGKLDSDLKVSGRVTYNGHGMEEFVPQRTAAYISQYDLHTGEMTVHETLAFSARCQGVGTQHDMLTELARREKEANIIPDPDLDVFMKAVGTEGQETNVVTDYIMKILGLDACADTMVGNEMSRGISGGQKKRVTTGEMLVGPAKVLLMDEISTGLDSSTTFQIVNSLRQIIHILGGTAVISLLQPAPETYDLFDDIILLSDGQVVYHGPRENVPEFFESMSFKCPERKGIADFLQEVTSRKDQQQYWIHPANPYRYVPPREFAAAFQLFHIGQSIRSELSIPYDKSKSHPAALATSKYCVSNKELLKACIWREQLLMRRNSFIHIFRAIQLMVVAFITMTLFLRTEMHHDSVIDGTIYMGALFFAIIVIAFDGYSEFPMTIMKLPVFFKQRDLLFYPAWAYALPTSVLMIPAGLVQVAIWVFMTYYVIGFDSDIGRCRLQCTGLVALLSRTMVIANIYGSFVFFVLAVMSGFLLSKGNIKKWWIWGYWISPLMYSQNALSTNEFLGKSWSHILPGTMEPLGVTILKSRGIFPEAKWYWTGVGALIGYLFLFNFLSALVLSYIKPFGKSQTAISEETLKEKEANITEEPFETPSRGRSSGIQMTSKSNHHNSKVISPHLGSSLTAVFVSAVITDEVHGRNTSSDSIAWTGSDQGMKGMVLPFIPLTITFENVRYCIDMPQEMKAQGIEEDHLEILRGVSGAFRPGVLTALMGVSGAGKTTLMDLLAGRKTSGYIEGNITVSGYPKKKETFTRVSGYCEQNDIHSPHVTVYESLVYSAWLRLPPEVDFATKQVFIEEVMELVELTPLREAMVGLPGMNGLSMEQRKRLTIAVELVANPSIIFMDEPTSGLDARTAAIVMRTVRNTVDTGRTVVCTIHQPSIDMFEAFDELFLMKQGGEEIYVGPLGQRSCHLINYFEEVEGIKRISEGYNPATWMLEVTTLVQEQILGVNFSEIYKKSELIQRNGALIRELSSPSPGSSDLYFPTRYSQNFITQCITCLWKQHLSYWRNPPYNAVRFFFTTIISLLCGTIYWDLGTKRTKRQDLFNAIGSIYISLLALGVQNASSVQPVLSVERTVYYRERAAGMYSAFPYAFGQLAIELPYVFVQTLLYGMLTYAMIGFEWTAAKFFWFMFFTYSTLLFFTFYGMMVVGLTPNNNLSTIISAGFYILWNLFAGFIIPRTRIPIWWRWYYWICPLSWNLHGLIVSQYGNVDDKLDTGETVSEFIRSYFGFKKSFLGVVAVVAAAFPMLFASLFAISTKMLNFQRR